MASMARNSTRIALAATAAATGLGTLAAGPAVASQPTVHPRVINVDGAQNVRDIGGYVTKDAKHAKHVRYGLVFRSANLSKVTPVGDATLAKLHLTAAIDFRSAPEVQSNGPDKLPPGVNAVADPIDPHMPTNIIQLLKSLKTPADSVRLMQNSYRSFVHDPTSGARLADALRRIAAAKGPVLYHCTAGKDRTGTETAILLTELGVGKKQVYADYLDSNKELAASNAVTEAQLQKYYGINPAVIDPVLTVKASYLDAAFAEIKKDYGSFDAFLAKGLHLSKATQAQLRNRLLT